MLRETRAKNLLAVPPHMVTRVDARVPELTIAHEDIDEVQGARTTLHLRRTLPRKLVSLGEHVIELGRAIEAAAAADTTVPPDAVGSWINKVYSRRCMLILYSYVGI